MALTVKATNGVDLPIDNLEQNFTYNGSGLVETISVEYQTIEYIQTFTYAGSKVTEISQWVAQP